MLNDNIYSISLDDELTKADDYAFLREEGIKYLKGFSGNLWSDHNLHDPGITILELLLYSIKDLAYRTSFNIPDLLTNPGKQTHEKDRIFYEAYKILPTHPITLTDYRKLIMTEVKGIRNVWFSLMDEEEYVVELEDGDPEKPVYVYADDALMELSFEPVINTPQSKPLKLRGLYRVKVELEEESLLSTKFAEYINNPITPSNPDVEAGLGVSFANDTEFLQKLDEIKLAYRMKIFELLSAHRNLCEDFAKIEIIETETVIVCADIEISPKTNEKKVYEAVYSAIYNYVSPNIPYYNLQQLVAQNIATETIFDGTTPHKAFVKNDELENFDLKRELHTSDLINIIMDIPGVVAVKKLHLSSYIYDILNNSWDAIYENEKFCLHLSDALNKCFKFYLDLDQAFIVRRNKINIYKGDFKVIIKYDANEINPLDCIQLSQWPEFLPSLYQFADIPSKHRELDKYISLQNDFPKTYATGQEGISDLATPLRKAQRLQLKAFLLFFDQILADYLAQLNNVQQLLSWKDIDDNQTYFFSKLSPVEIKDLEDLMRDRNTLFDPVSNAGYNGEYHLFLENTEKKEDRRNRLLDHLMSRFCEVAIDWALVGYLYKQDNTQVLDNAEFINDKVDFLRDYVKISRDRSHAFNYLKEFVNLPNAVNSDPLVDSGVHLPNYNISGFEERMFRVLGLENHGFKYLEYPVFSNPANDFETNYDGIDGVLQNPAGVYNFIDQANGNLGLRFDERFGFHLFEHLLLRPRYSDKSFYNNSDCYQPDGKSQLLGACVTNDWDELEAEKCFCNDPYSFRCTIVAAGWHKLSLDLDFRRFFEKTVREQAPAHITWRICWVSPEIMYQLEYWYARLVPAMADVAKFQYTKFAPSTDVQDMKRIVYEHYTYYLKNFIAVFARMKNIYPGTRLLDCDGLVYDSDYNIANHPIVLNRSALGQPQVGYKFVPGDRRLGPGPLPGTPTGYLANHGYNRWKKN